MTNRFLPREHLRRPADFKRVFEARCSCSEGSLLVFVARNGLTWNRVGLSVSKKLIGNAVKRNRTKRVLREAYRLTKAKLTQGFDIVFVPRSIELPEFDELQAMLPRMIQNAIGRSKPPRDASHEVAQ